MKTNAMLGRCRKPPLDEEEMMKIAKSLLLRKGDDRLWNVTSKIVHIEQ